MLRSQNYYYLYELPLSVDNLEQTHKDNPWVGESIILIRPKIPQEQNFLKDLLLLL
uniref:Uncharacterized protein n=1 Tax=Rhizophora mucronata TaxID=61149 RepID=A0A2P2MZE4_RHIMU